MDSLFDNFGPSFVPVCFMVSTVGMIALALALSYRQSQVLREAWDGVAMRTGLTLEPGNMFIMPVLRGDYRRRPLMMNIFTRGSSKNRTHYTRITLSVSNSSGGRLGITPEGLLSGLGKALGMQDIPLGSERFDKSFMVRGNPPEFVSEIMGDMMLQDSLLRLRDTSAFELSLEGSSLMYVQRGMMKDPDIIIEIYNVLTDIADKVDGSIRSSF